MRTPKLSLWIGLLAILLVSGPVARAQFYAPDTEYHDRAQRHFVVELARVIAWRENQGAAAVKIAEITDEVTLGPDRRTTWKIHWLSVDGKPLRDAEVSYPESALLGGPAWYRDVARQLGVKPAAGHLNSADASSKAYWAGAEKLASSRADTLRAVFDLAPEKDPAGFAGLLAHVALPSVGGGVSLDSVLLARSAAWLCVAEQSATSPGDAPDALWAPILFLSGRENAAAEAWEKSAPAAGTLAQGWAFLLSHPSSKDLFTFAGNPANRRWAVPLLVYQSRLYHLEEAAPDAIERLFTDEQSVAALHDYGPFLARETGVGGGRLLEGAFPALSRQAWLACLRQFKPEPLDFAGYTDALAKIKAEPAPASDSSETDASVAGLIDAAPLLNLGFSEGLGKLTPTAAVTARDLLNLGWEMNNRQMGARWEFVNKTWGIQPLAESIAEAALGALDGADRFFVDFPYGYHGNPKPPAWKYVKGAPLVNGSRLQEIDGENGEWVVYDRSFNADKKTNALLWVRRGWLRPAFLLHQGCELFFSGARDAIAIELGRMQGEGGPQVDSGELSFFAYGLRPSGAKTSPGSDELRLKLLAGQAEPSAASYAASWGKYEELPPFEAAQESEKLFWRRPGSDLPYDQIFSDYVRAHAYESARRFYKQSEDVASDSVGFSNSMGPQRFTLALLENDEAAMKEALNASSSGSYSDMVVNMVAAAAEGDFKALAAQVDECLDRYPPQDEAKGDMMTMLKGFLPLVPALKDASSADHAKALDYFAKYSQWPTLQWVFIRGANLPVEQAVRFLGGKDTDVERRMLVAYLLKDREMFTKAYDEIDSSNKRGGKKWSTMAFVVAHYLRNDLLAVPTPAAQVDLKPPGAESVLQALNAAAPKPVAEPAAPEEDLSKFATADALWAHLEEIKKGPATPPTTRAAATAFVNRMAAAATEFPKRFPKDPRRWEAKMLAIELSGVIAQLNGDEPDPAAQEAPLQEIAGAPDAPAEIRSEARYALVRRHVEAADGEKLPPEAEAEIEKYAKDFPRSEHVGQLQMMRVKGLQAADPAKAHALLVTLSKDSNPEVAQGALGELAMEEAMAKPLEMKFTALDGSQFDLGKLRGKVVLIDFWATWCGPCMAEAPKVLAAYKKLHAQGFEIVGISLDQDKSKVLQVTKAKEMTWPQYFDGKGWKTEISAKYGITSIPRMWLVNKKGMLVDAQAREGLEEAIEKLLAE